jgi:hypothetical protein
MKILKSRRDGITEYINSGNALMTSPHFCLLTSYFLLMFLLAVHNRLCYAHVVELVVNADDD